MKTVKDAVKKETAKTEKVQNSKTAQVEKSTSRVDEILNPTADGRIKKLEIFNRLAERKQKIDGKLTELVKFNASNDGTESKMEFSANNGYRFTISNPATIKMLLGTVEKELKTLQEENEKEVLEFQI